MKKTIKVFAVIDPTDEEPAPTPGIWFDKNKEPMPHGYFYELFWRRETAAARKEAINRESRRYYKIIPVTITYTLPPRKKSKKK